MAALIDDYRQQHEPAKPTPTGLFYRGKRGTAECWELLAEGEQAEMVHSMSNQADNPRTEAGKDARTNNSRCSGEDPFSSDQPAPDWAGISDEGSTKESSEQKEDHGLAGDGQVAPAQRRLNAFLAALAHTTSGGTDAEPSKTITPQVAVHLKLDSLKDLQDPNKLAAVTAHGVKLDAAVTGKLICQGEICRVLIGADGQPLDLGRSQRFFSEAIKNAAFARDRGCIVPGCTAPPEMIEYHYDDWWSRGGSTSCSNASCLCRRRHLAIHAGLLTLVKINGLAHILFPKHLDPSQTPGRNQLHAAA